MTARWRLVPIVFLSLTMHAAIAAILMTNRNTHVLVKNRSVEALPVVIVPEAAFAQSEHAKPADAALPDSASDEPDTEIGAAAIRMPALELGDEPPHVELAEPLTDEPAAQPKPMATVIETEPPVVTLPPLALNGTAPQIDVADPAPDVAAEVTEPPVPQPRQPELVPARPVLSAALPATEPKRNIVKVKPPRQEVRQKPIARQEKPARVKEAPPKQARADERQPDSQLKKASSSGSSVKGSDKAGAKSKSVNAGGGSAPSAGKPVAASKAAMAGYGRRVNGHVARHKPRGAPGKGSVGIVLQIARSGALVGAKLASGSGNPALDRMALAAARGAAPYPAPPESVSGARVAVMIRMSFR